MVVGRIEGWRSWCARRSLSHVADGGMDMSVRIARMLKEWTAVVGEVGDQCRVRIARERERERVRLRRRWTGAVAKFQLQLVKALQ